MTTASFRLPCNDWTTGETATLIRLVEERAGRTAIYEELRRFKNHQIADKIERLVTQGFLTVPGQVAR